MAQQSIYVCDVCDGEVHQHDMPVVFVVYCGVVPGREGTYVDEDPNISTFERGLIAKPISRVELDPTCLRKLIRPTTEEMEAQLVKAGLAPELAAQVAAAVGLPKEFLADLFNEER